MSTKPINANITLPVKGAARDCICCCLLQHCEEVPTAVGGGGRSLLPTPTSIWQVLQGDMCDAGLDARQPGQGQAEGWGVLNLLRAFFSSANDPIPLLIIHTR